MQEQILQVLMKDEDVSWKEMIYNIVQQEGMDPWDINITLLTQKYISLVKKMREHDLRLSGKVLLAAAILLKIKSTHFVDTDISNLDRLINQSEEALEEELLDELQSSREKQQFKLIPRNPQPRNRKVSINDLVEALQRAMASKKRILARQKPAPMILPQRGIDILEVIGDVYHKIVYYTSKNKSDKLTFSALLPSKAEKRDKVYTFVPLLHLENLQKVETEQEQPFGEIFIKLVEKSKAQ